jgi:hypothetical protein
VLDELLDPPEPGAHVVPHPHDAHVLQQPNVLHDVEVVHDGDEHVLALQALAHPVAHPEQPTAQAVVLHAVTAHAATLPPEPSPPSPPVTDVVHAGPKTPAAPARARTRSSLGSMRATPSRMRAGSPRSRNRRRLHAPR